MDSKLRLILRQYQLQPTEELAIQIANAISRTGPEISEVPVWICSFFNNQNGYNSYGSTVHIFLTLKLALEDCLGFLEEALDDQTIFYHTPNQYNVLHELILNLEKQIVSNNLDYAQKIVIQINAVLPPDVNIDVYQDTIKDSIME